MDGSNDSEEIRTPRVPTALEVEDEAMDTKVSTQPETLDVGHVNTNMKEAEEGYPRTQPTVDSGSPVEKAATAEVEVGGMDGDLWMEDRRAPPADIKDKDSDRYNRPKHTPHASLVNHLELAGFVYHSDSGRWCGCLVPGRLWFNPPALPS